MSERGRDNEAARNWAAKTAIGRATPARVPTQRARRPARAARGPGPRVPHWLRIAATLVGLILVLGYAEHADRREQLRQQQELCLALLRAKSPAYASTCDRRKAKLPLSFSALGESR